jgi:cobalt-zinc-cadmium efflux system outer membrane protein
VGREGFFKVGVDLPIFDRKRGAIQAARARVESARAETERVRLSLQERMADAYRQYATATAMAERYRDRMIPKAEQAYGMYLQNFRAMSGAYPQVLIAQRNWFQLQRDYVRTLERVWTSALLIDGLLLEGALESPVMIE